MELEKVAGSVGCWAEPEKKAVSASYSVELAAVEPVAAVEQAEVEGEASEISSARFKVSLRAWPERPAAVVEKLQQPGAQNRRAPSRANRARTRPRN